MTRSKNTRVYDLTTGNWKRPNNNIEYYSDSPKPLLIVATILIIAMLLFISCNCCSIKVVSPDSTTTTATTPVTTTKPEPQPYEVRESVWLAYNTICALCGESIHKQRAFESNVGEKATYVKDKYGLVYCPVCGRKLILDFEKEQEDKRKLEEVLNNGNVE